MSLGAPWVELNVTLCWVARKPKATCPPARMSTRAGENFRSSPAVTAARFPGGGLTVTGAFAALVMPSLVPETVIDADPWATAVTSPLDETVAVDGLLAR